ncbi:MAG: Outer rane lipoprotein omp16 precursor [Labilithrix sp.]|nr:Outer rane lipoprotein omp16 precursor [Labilithrix sp.]
MERLQQMLCLATAAVAGSCVVLGCASTPPPKELRDARAGYQLAASSPGAIRAQADIADAKKSLDRAEAAFADDPSGNATREWSYIASRKSGSARAKANALTAIEEKRAADIELRNLRAQQQSRQRAELEGSRGQLASEKQARAAAEQKTRDALATIAGMRSVQSDRGLVLTLSGSVLFATGKSVLLPAAQTRLKEAAKALKEDGRRLTVVGHTDSSGSDETNQQLSLARAEAVRTYLVGQGLASDKAKAEGAGESQPNADNATAEGRANNRRVEVILENEKP